MRVQTVSSVCGRGGAATAHSGELRLSPRLHHRQRMPAPSRFQMPSRGSRSARSSSQINFSSTEVAGNIGGLIFVVGSVFIVAIGLPSVIWFLFAATIAGCILAWALVTWHTRHPKRGLPENLIVLR